MTEQPEATPVDANPDEVAAAPVPDDDVEGTEDENPGPPEDDAGGQDDEATDPGDDDPDGE